jgi:hypothetical protein
VDNLIFNRPIILNIDQSDVQQAASSALETFDIRWQVMCHYALQLNRDGQALSAFRLNVEHSLKSHLSDRILGVVAVD